MEIVKIKIDGREHQVKAGLTILEAAREVGIDIPTLCFLKDIHETGDCRMCIVEIEGRRALTPSCNTLAEDGMIVCADLDITSALRDFMSQGQSFTSFGNIVFNNCKIGAGSHLRILKNTSEIFCTLIFR